MAPTLTAHELAYLRGQRLGRLATVDSSGAPQNNPVGFFVDEPAGQVLIGGFALAKTRKFRNVSRNPHVALVVDDLASTDPWRVRGVEIRGTATATTTTAAATTVTIVTTVTTACHHGPFQPAPTRPDQPTKIPSWAVDRHFRQSERLRPGRYSGYGPVGGEPEGLPAGRTYRRGWGRVGVC